MIDQRIIDEAVRIRRALDRIADALEAINAKRPTPAENLDRLHAIAERAKAAEAGEP